MKFLVIFLSSWNTLELEDVVHQGTTALPSSELAYRCANSRVSKDRYLFSQEIFWDNSIDCQRVTQTHQGIKNP